MRLCVLALVVFALNANPIVVEVINEFQVAPYDSERVELRYLQSSALDTVFSDNHPLFNIAVGTPAGQALIDANLYLSGIEPTVIDRAVLTGNFGLPDDSGFVSIGLFDDSIRYPADAPAPPVYWSAAKFHCYTYVWNEYYLISDWYLDATPTFGAPNDDYPGCIASGYVYDLSSQPLSGARVTATVFNTAAYVFPPMPYYTCCTTSTAVNGAYSFDSLLPCWYEIVVCADGHLPDTQVVGQLCWIAPVANINFYLPTGIAEYGEHNARNRSRVYPNPFYDYLHITLSEPVGSVDIYDVTGMRMRRINNENKSTDFVVDCADLPRGIYFIALKEQKLKIIKL